MNKKNVNLIKEKIKGDENESKLKPCIHFEIKNILDMIKTMTKIDFKTKNSVSKMKWFSQKL